VTRPGLAPIASALAVELCVGLLHHPMAHHAPASSALSLSDAVPYPLGVIPHQIRGTLSHMTTVQLEGSAFEHCTACSPHVLDHADIWMALRDPLYLENVSGLTALKAAVDDTYTEDDDCW
jgi:ubiquitin-like modifier-activating enzyme ATG7